MHHLTNWTEIPVLDMRRATAFYEGVLGVSLHPMNLGPNAYAMFPAKDRFNTGALVHGEGHAPSPSGTLVYLDAENEARLDTILARVTGAGGAVVSPKILLSPEAGWVAVFSDTEGNRVGLQAPVVEAAPVDATSLQAILARASQRLAFVLRRGPSYDDPASAPLQWAHAQNMVDLLRAKKLVSVTAFVDGVDVLGVGVLASTDRAEAEALLDADPGVRGGRLTYSLLSSMSFGEDDVQT